MKKQKIFFATLAFALFAFFQTAQAQMTSTSTGKNGVQSSPYLSDSPGTTTTTMQTVTYSSAMDGVGIDVRSGDQANAFSGSYAIYMQERVGGPFVEVRSGQLFDSGDPYGYDVSYYSPGSNQLRVVITTSNPEMVGVVFKQ